LLIEDEEALLMTLSDRLVSAIFKQIAILLGDFHV
jgi:hypothetical protein